MLETIKKEIVPFLVKFGGTFLMLLIQLSSGDAAQKVAAGDVSKPAIYALVGAILATAGKAALVSLGLYPQK